MNMGAFPSGQWGQTVNLLLNASVVRIHQLPPKRTRNLGCGFFFVLELVGFEQVGRPQTAKNSPADCFRRRGQGASRREGIRQYAEKIPCSPHSLIVKFCLFFCFNF